MFNANDVIIKQKTSSNKMSYLILNGSATAVTATDG